ncbi:hypothetical protein EIP91_010992 [Steccherinum ochraceum]|uniref:DEAD/DEAH-box helicase domain-containing protein n=1 Tax=Steccherinum ochraceum TaxID=92696 RepID=A0A4R0RYT4_9APHY|nr:hypothetical protein EIP91_010992 [Steccherinum ochraceum]
MSENTPPSNRTWPPPNRHHRPPADTESTRPTPVLSPRTPTTPAPTSKRVSEDLDKLETSKVKRRRTFQNGFETPVRAPSYKPYALPSTGRKRGKAIVVEAHDRVSAIKPLELEKWQKLVEDAGVLPSGARVKEFQMECANAVVERKTDVCLIAPTGAGKSLIWTLPLLAAAKSVSLVITPYTSLGTEGQQRIREMKVTSIYVNSEQKSSNTLKDIVKLGCREGMGSRLPVYTELIISEVLGAGVVTNAGVADKYAWVEI